MMCAYYACVYVYMQVVEALQQAGGRCRLNVVLDGPVVVDIALLQRQVRKRVRGGELSRVSFSRHSVCALGRGDAD